MFETRYEYAVDGSGHTGQDQPHLFICATPSNPDSRHPSLRIHAERRYVLTDPRLPDGIRGLDVRERLASSSISLYPTRLLGEPSTEHMYLPVIALARGEIAGRSCADALWTVLHGLILSDSARAEWVESLGSPWLSEVAAEAREGAPGLIVG